MDIAIEATNPKGKYQIMFWLQIILLPFTTLVIVGGYAFLTKAPTIYCRQKDMTALPFSKCDMAFYCKNKSNFDMIVSKKESIDNFALEYDLYCERNFYNSLISSFFFAGCIAGVFLWSKLPDIYGRYQIYKWLLYLNLFIQLNFLLRINIYHLIITSFISGTSTYSLNIQNILVIETFDRKVASIAMSMMNAGYGIVGIFLGLYCLSVNNLTILLTINVIIAFVCVVLTLVYLTESPRWLNANHRVKEAVAVLKTMAEINGTTEQFNKFYEENKELVLHSNERVNIHGTKYTVLDIFKMKSQRWTLIGVMYVFFTIAVCFYGIFITLNQLMDDFYINSFLVFIAEIIAELGSGFLVNIFGRVKVTVVACNLGGIAFIISGILKKSVVKTVLLFIASFGIAGSLNIMYIYSNEAFPLTIRALTFGFLFLFSRIGGVFVPLFINNNVYPYILGALAISCGIVFSFMKETRDMELEDEVPEAKVEIATNDISRSHDYK